MEKAEKICPVEFTLALLGGKWKLVVLYQLSRGTKRFKELEKLIPSVTPRMLIKVLKELEEQGVVHRELYPVIPPKVEYSLTEEGCTVLPLIREIKRWGSSYLERVPRAENK
ncbi:MAG: helix-turn-helix transcriptional regulator [Ferruginibacter sp.]|nr:helix-turn-helix transcriptional regulator [Cytophagales bacterium]